MIRRALGSVVIIWAMLGAWAVAASAKDYSSVSRNILPSGQYGALPIPPEADDQALMYDGLTPLFDQVGAGDLNTYFKSGKFGLDTDGPGTVEPTPNNKVTITRDAFHVPHIKANKEKDGIWAAGWLLATDRALLLQQARFNARVAAVDVPGVTALGLISSLQNFVPSEQTENELAKQTKVLKRAGKDGKNLLKHIDWFIAGINDYLAANSPATEPWTRNDVYAVNALKGQFLGQGGGDEARNSQFLSGLIDATGAKKGWSIFNDLRQFKNKSAPTSIDGKHPYGKIPDKAPGSAMIDPGSFTAADVVGGRPAPERFRTDPVEASNTLQINAERSATGYPLMVGGPQIGYFYPGFTYEMEMDAGEMRWRGVTSAPFPGYLLIGRGEDFAITLTSASADIIDQFAEKLCGGSDTMYMHNGKCKKMELFNAGTLGGEKVEFLRTVHGPVVGWATVDGKKVAISSQRSSYGQDTLDQLFFQRLSDGRVRSPKSFYKAANKTPQTFNSFYMDHENNAMFTSGLLPKRHPKTDPGLPAWGTGEYEWNGFIGRDAHPQGKNPKDGTLTNWNNNAARGFGAADDNWARSGTHTRVDVLDYNLGNLADGNGKWQLHDVVAAMNAGATQDVRAIDTVPLLRKVLKGSAAPSDQAEEMLKVLKDWRTKGGSRLDVDLDGEIDHPGAAVIDGAWDQIADAVMGPRLPGPLLDEFATLHGRYSTPPGGQYSGWHQYMARDLRSVRGKNQKAPLRNSYCGKGDLAKCQAAIWDAFATAGAEIEVDQGSANPANWRADATAERISFAPGLLPTTMRYANRPSGTQVVASFDGHRKK